MDSDILHRFKCIKCGFLLMSFNDEEKDCPSCNSAVSLRINNIISSVSTTVGLYNVQFDSVDSLDEDISTEVERVELDKDLVEMEKARRGEGISSEQ